MRYYISDCHFFHKGVMNRLDKRGFFTLEEMHEYMINQWNNKVRKNDEVVILGDLSFGKAKETNEIIKKLNGRKMLIVGNHDKWVYEKEFDPNLFLWVKDYAELNDNKRKVILSHYPIVCYNGQFRKDNDGNATTYMLYGHVHFTQDNVALEQYKDIVRKYPRASRSDDIPVPAPMQMINCFCMLSDYVPLSLDEWIEIENSGLLRNKIQQDWYYDK